MVRTFLSRVNDRTLSKKDIVSKPVHSKKGAIIDV